MLDLQIKCPYRHRQVVFTKSMVDTTCHTFTLNAAVNRATGRSRPWNRLNKERDSSEEDDGEGL
jgi:hypothetical protein